MHRCELTCQEKAVYHFSVTIRIIIGGIRSLSDVFKAINFREPNALKQYDPTSVYRNSQDKEYIQSLLSDIENSLKNLMAELAFKKLMEKRPSNPLPAPKVRTLNLIQKKDEVWHELEQLQKFKQRQHDHFHSATQYPVIWTPKNIGSLIDIAQDTEPNPMISASAESISVEPEAPPGMLNF